MLSPVADSVFNVVFLRPIRTKDSREPLNVLFGSLHDEAAWVQSNLLTKLKHLIRNESNMCLLFVSSSVSRAGLKPFCYSE